MYSYSHCLKEPAKKVAWHIFNIAYKAGYAMACLLTGVYIQYFENTRSGMFCQCTRILLAFSYHNADLVTGLEHKQYISECALK